MTAVNCITHGQSVEELVEQIQKDECGHVFLTFE